jgi:hypothetical protein
MPVSYGIARLLNDIIEEGKRPRTQREDGAYNALVLGAGSIKEMIQAKRQAQLQFGSARTRPRGV